MVTTVDQPTETPVATADSKYDEAWARKQVEPYFKESYGALLAQEWNKVYDLYSDEAKAGCSRSSAVSKMTASWLFAQAFGIDEIFKAQLQELKDGVLVITFSEITPEHITYSVADGESETIIREHGKWLCDDPLEQDCASLAMETESTPAPTVVRTATPKATPTPAAGLSRGNALPLGQTAVVPPGWEVAVLGVDEDAWPEVQAANPYNDPPEQGYRMVLITVRVTNVQTKDEAATISQSDFELVGSRNQVYQTFDRSCGVTPNELRGELFPSGTVEGTICFQAGTDETGLLLVASPSWDKEDQRYLALQ
jgi:hypothetical protein